MHQVFALAEAAMRSRDVARGPSGHRPSPHRRSRGSRTASSRKSSPRSTARGSWECPRHFPFAARWSMAASRENHRSAARILAVFPAVAVRAGETAESSGTFAAGSQSAHALPPDQIRRRKPRRKRASRGVHLVRDRTQLHAVFRVIPLHDAGGITFHGPLATPKIQRPRTHRPHSAAAKTVATPPRADTLRPNYDHCTQDPRIHLHHRPPRRLRQTRRRTNRRRQKPRPHRQRPEEGARDRLLHRLRPLLAHRRRLRLRCRHHRRVLRTTRRSRPHRHRRLVQLPPPSKTKPPPPDSTPAPSMATPFPTP